MFGEYSGRKVEIKTTKVEKIVDKNQSLKSEIQRKEVSTLGKKRKTRKIVRKNPKIRGFKRLLFVSFDNFQVGVKIFPVCIIDMFEMLDSTISFVDSKIFKNWFQQNL